MPALSDQHAAEASSAFPGRSRGHVLAYLTDNASMSAGLADMPCAVNA
ncbi:hypothetical protein [Streptomyces sp. NK08204]|nr:hypothetical protein [Streptomyces sp. NK08204]